VTNRRSIRYVSWSDWIDIQYIFPNAIEHRRKRIVSEVEEDLNGDFGCPECMDKATAADSFRNKLSALLRSDEYAQRCDVLAEETPSEADTGGAYQKEYRVMHEEDLLAWKKFVSAAKRKINRGGSSIDDHTRRLLKPLVEWDDCALLSLETTTLGSASPKARCAQFLSAVVRPIACRKHKLPISAALFQDQGFEDRPSLKSLNSNICILTEAAYQSLVSHWTSVIQATLPSDESNAITVLDDEDEDEIDSFEEECPDDKNQVKWFHPSFRRHVISNGQSKRPVFALTSDKMSMRFVFDSGVCNDPACNEAYSRWYDAEISAKSQNPKCSPPSSSHESTKTPGSAADEPITIDCDLDFPTSSGTVLLKVFEAEKRSRLDSILADLASTSGLSDGSSDASHHLRRSSRKRKTRYPSGVIVSEDSVNVNLKANVAALRLLLLERCANGSPFQLSHSLRLVVPSPVAAGCINDTAASEEAGGVSEQAVSNTNLAPKVIELPLDMSGDVVEDVIPAASEEAGGVPEQAVPNTNFAPKVIELSLDMSGDVVEDVIARSFGMPVNDLAVDFSDVFIVRQADEDSGIDETPQENLLDHLIGLANISNIDDTNPQKKRKVRVERGFTGTLLVSRLAPAPEGRGSAVLEKDEYHLADTVEVLSGSRDGVRESGDRVSDGSLRKAKREDDSGESKNDAKESEDNDPKLYENNREGVMDFEVESIESAEEDKLAVISPPKRLKTDAPGDATGLPNPAGDYDIQVSPSIADNQLTEPDRTLSVVECLLKNPDVDRSHQSFCYDAALWTVNRHPTMPFDQLVEKAYTKYVDIVFNFN
jgi:hypothetical protein